MVNVTIPKYMTHITSAFYSYIEKDTVALCQFYIPMAGRLLRIGTESKNLSV